MSKELDRLRPFEARGFCAVEGSRVKVEPVGRLFLRQMAMVFDEYLPKAPQEGQRFSRTV